MSCGELYPVPAPGLDTVVVDLDGTLVENVWPDRGLGKTIQAGVDLIWHYAKLGYRIEVWSSRREIDEPLVWQWVWDNDLPVDAVVCGRKRLAGLYVDDRAYRPLYTRRDDRDGKD